MAESLWFGFISSFIRLGNYGNDLDLCILLSSQVMNFLHPPNLIPSAIIPFNRTIQPTKPSRLPSISLWQAYPLPNTAGDLFANMADAEERLICCQTSYLYLSSFRYIRFDDRTPSTTTFLALCRSGRELLGLAMGKEQEAAISDTVIHSAESFIQDDEVGMFNNSTQEQGYPLRGEW